MGLTPEERRRFLELWDRDPAFRAEMKALGCRVIRWGGDGETVHLYDTETLEVDDPKDYDGEDRLS